MKYLLLAPIDMNNFDSSEELTEALEEFGLTYITSAGNSYIISKSLDALAQAAFNLDLPGDIVEYSVVYESKEEETETVKE
jgi:hypothetical protein